MGAKVERKTGNEWNIDFDLHNVILDIDLLTERVGFRWGRIGILEALAEPQIAIWKIWANVVLPVLDGAVGVG